MLIKHGAQMLNTWTACSAFTANLCSDRD